MPKTIRAYVTLAAFDVKKHPNGCHYVDLQIDGATVEQAVYPEGGQWCVNLNYQRPRIPEPLRRHVTVVTSHEQHCRKDSSFASVPSGRFRFGKAMAEVSHEPFGGEPYVVIQITAPTVPALTRLRNKLVYGKTQPLTA